MSWGRRVIRITLCLLVGCVLAFVALAAVVSLADVENNSTGDDIAEFIYLTIWAVAAASFIALVVGGVAALRERSR